MPPATTSTEAILLSLRERLLAFVPKAGGPTLGAQLAGVHKVYLEWLPDDAPYPNGALAVDLFMGGVDAPVMLQGEAVLLLRARQRAQAAALSAMGDLAVQALAGWLAYDADGRGMFKVTAAQSQSVPTPTEPADRELVTVRVSASLFAFPQFLTQYGAPASS